MIIFCGDLFLSLSPREERTGREPERGASYWLLCFETNLLSPALSSGCARRRGSQNAPPDVQKAFYSLLLERRVGGLRYGFGADTFFQGNSLLLDAMVAEAIQDYSGGLAVDLYAGVGLFALQIAGRSGDEACDEKCGCSGDAADE